MNDTTVYRERLTAPLDRVLQRLSSMGKVMVVAQDGGVTHERIGVIEKISKVDNRIVLAGAAHDCTVDMVHVASAVADRSGRMKEKVLPKLEFLNPDGKLLFSIIGLDGLEKFDDALARFAGEPVAMKVKEQGPSAKLPSDDVGLRPLLAASKAGAAISIEMHKPGLVQRWSGIIPAVNAAMGFINIIAADFHLHVRGGAVAKWQAEDDAGSGRVRLSAIGVDDKPTGLVLRGPRHAFQPS